MTETLLNNAPELWGAIGVIIGTLVIIFAGVGVTALTGTKALEYGKMLFAEIKGQRKVIYGAIDEATDTIPQQVAALTPWDDDPAMLSAMLKAMVEVALQYRPAQEVNMTITGEPADIAKEVDDALHDALNKSKLSQ